MDCEKLRMLLDDYVDGTLPEIDARALEAHASTCEDCRCELRAAQLLRDALKDMDEEIAVPLKAQAAWRSAVRAEAKKEKKRRGMRIIGAVAAALAVVLGSTLLLNGKQAAQPLPLTLEARAMDELIDADGGEAAPAQSAFGAQNDYTAWKKLEVAQLQAAVEAAKDLAAEYSGSLEMLEDDVCRIELPADYMDDFLSAIAHVGAELDSEIVAPSSDRAIIYIQLLES